MFNKLAEIFTGLFGRIETAGDHWLTGLLARFVFLAVLFVYYENSASLKVEEGFAGFFQPSFGAYIQILSEKTMEAYEFDAANVPFHLKLIVYLGTYSEFILPVLVVLGLFTRIAALGMIVFVLVQSFVDVRFHGVEGETLGHWFDRDPSSIIMDQRLLWIFVLAVLVIKGAGLVSVDHFLRRRLSPAPDATAA